MNPFWAHIRKYLRCRLALFVLAAAWLPLPAWSEHGEENVAPTVAMQPSFSSWLAAFRTEAVAKGISEATLDKSLTGLTPLDRVLELDRKQPEFALPFEDYLKQIASPKRIARGAEKLRDHKALLSKIEAKYGVPATVLVALWGVESDYGRLGGRFSVIQCLATLAFDGRRATFFRAELINALKIIDAGHVEPSAMVGSWAGAMGQTQFMPSTFLNYAVDFSGDGHIDIWNSTEDALASSANYLAKLGWKSDESWGREVTVPAEFDVSLFGGKVRKSIPEWAALGIKRADGRPLPTRNLQAGLIQLNGRKKHSYLTYANFAAIHEWNRSLQFATTVGLIADELGKVARKH